MQTPLKFINHLFPVWALLLSGIVFYFPALFAALKPVLREPLMKTVHGFHPSGPPSAFHQVFPEPADRSEA